jgi:uncharacterized protein YndB with AHSA1/START domain
MSPAPAAALQQSAVRVGVLVRVPLATAFELFTRDIDLWWRRGPRFRNAGTRAGVVHIDPHVDGRVFESIEDEHGPRTFEIGRVSAWEPPHRLVFSWRNANFAAGEVTEVEVQFRESKSGTQVEVTHRGWAALRADHPARHGQADQAYARMLGLWWGEQMNSMREFALHHLQERRTAS